MISKILVALRSFLFCWKFMSFRQALKRPVQIPWNMKIILGKNAQLRISCKELRPYMIKLGFIGAKFSPQNRPLLYIGDEAKFDLSDNVIFGNGCIIWIDSKAEMKVGESFYCNANCTFRCSSRITLEDKVLMGWNVFLNTTDGHRLEIDGETKNNEGEIHIGYHSWVASDTIIGKGVAIGNDCVVAQRSLVNRSFCDSNLLIAGIPAKIVRKNVHRLD